MNEANFDKLVNYIKAQPDDAAPQNWTWDYCFSGMVQAIEGKRVLGGSYISQLGEWLDISDEVEYKLHFLSSGSRHSDFISEYNDNGGMSRAEQKTFLLEILRQLKADGDVDIGKAYELVTDGASV